MAGGGYEDFFQSPTLGPGWMHGLWGNRFWKAIGKMLDEQTDRFRQARKASFPDGAVALQMDDALDRIGDDRMLPRGGSAPNLSDEAAATYAARLKSAFTTWGQDDKLGGGAGSVLGILTQLKVAGFPVEPTGTAYWTTGAMLVNHLGWLYQLANGALTTVGQASVCVNRQNLDGSVSGTLPGWTLDARDQFYSHFMILFLQDVPTLTNADCPAKSRLNAICNRWKSGSAIYSGCAVIPQESSAIVWGWGFPAGTHWGDSGLKWGTNGARFIDPQ